MTARRPQPRFGLTSIVEMPRGYYIDFSYVNMPLDKDGWTWQFNIPLGGTEGHREQHIRRKVWELQRQHGCNNVASGNGQPLGRHIGVYVGPRDGQHRTMLSVNGNSMCRCFG